MLQLLASEIIVEFYPAIFVERKMMLFCVSDFPTTILQSADQPSLAPKKCLHLLVSCLSLFGRVRQLLLTKAMTFFCHFQDKTPTGQN